ncbi:hypothetical protein [Sphingomonas endophytica]|uniref:Uncharacterized protein n=1 Tax=Sphingomonas endophytica TaxID=869719 RepID=A0A147HYH7_9SPHN|nr:hypothetical protein [Sphingomonas endophytica]KTT70003.1 hypothetical protein NS334_13395 [Sphingomonas endophytica]
MNGSRKRKKSGAPAAAKGGIAAQVRTFFAAGTRPPSIVRFERLYLASFLVGLIGWAVSWQGTADRLAVNATTAPFGWLLPAALLVSSAITLGLWYLVARRASLAAKWAVTVLTGLATLRFLVNVTVVLRGSVPVLALLLSLIILTLGIVATIQLFRPDAQSWFGEAVALDGEDR